MAAKLATGGMQMVRSAKLIFAGALAASALLVALPAYAGCWTCGCAPRAIVYAPAGPAPCVWSGPVYVVNQGPAYGEPIPIVAPARPSHDPLAYPYVYEDYGYAWPGYGYGWRGYRSHWRAYYRHHTRPRPWVRRAY